MRERQFKLFNDLFLFSMKTKELKIFRRLALKVWIKSSNRSSACVARSQGHFSHTFSAVLTMPKSAPNDLLISTGSGVSFSRS